MASSQVEFKIPLWPCWWAGVGTAPCPVMPYSVAGLCSSLRKHPRHLHIPPGAGKAAAALKLQPSSYWHEKENREGTGEGKGGEERERKRRREERKTGKKNSFNVPGVLFILFICLFFFFSFFFSN